VIADRLGDLLWVYEPSARLLAFTRIYRK
jgi:hypothetical protein